MLMRPLNYVQEFKSVAQEHERRHSGEKRYECKTCAKKYADSKSLKNQMKTHATDDEPIS